MLSVKAYLDVFRLFQKGKTDLIAEFYKTNLHICGNFGRVNPGLINMV